MPTPAERKALLFLAGLLVLGTGARMQRAAGHATPPSRASQKALARQITRVDSARAQAGRPRHTTRRAVVRASNGATTPPIGGKHSSPTARARTVRAVTPQITALGAGTVDLDRASAADIERLPGIGPVLAARIVADRDALGPFGSITAVERVKGIGPATAKRIAPYVTFSLQPRPSGVTPRAPPARPRRRRRRHPGPGSGYPRDGVGKAPSP